VVLIVLGTTSLGFHLTTRGRIYRWGKARQRNEGLRLKQLQEGLGSIKDVKLLGREGDFLGQYSLHNNRHKLASQYKSLLNLLPRLWLETIVVVGTAVLVFILVLRGRTIETIVPILGLFAAGAFRLIPTTNRIISAAQSLRYGLPAIHLIHSELALGAPPPREGDSGPLFVFQSEISLKGVEYTYANAPRPALHQVTLSIAKGECVGVIGPSGSGKSTLVDVILGLLPYDAGQVAVDGRDIRTVMRSWQDQIGYVAQSIYLTDDTLRRNVAFGIPADRIDDHAVRRALRAARLDDFVAAHPEGLDLVVGERGVRLSGGQRQRVGIARALYHDPAVLVLDEATSALDTTTEDEIMRAVLDMHGEKTILIVAHRLSTVERCDRLYRIEAGQVVGEGIPREMLV
jgi:ABC-type multidrug transport system fused ATPase/permease subunit